MTEKAKISETVQKTVIDLKDNAHFSRNRYLSNELISAIDKRLQNNEQTLLFLNRRGTARLILCRSCGWQATCPKCDTPLIYHGDKHIMRCHSCGYKRSPPIACPKCHSEEIVYKSIGTKSLVDMIQSLYPSAVVKRFDTDNSASEKLSKNFSAVHKGEVDIIIGTQMLGKGLDLPKLSLVGIINAETGLGVPDYSSSERNYQLLHQAIGRVGRGHSNGEVIMQTFNPSNRLVKAAIEQDWQDLYETELADRKVYKYPPYVFMLKISVSRKTANSAESYTSNLYDLIKNVRLPIEIGAPTPAFFERVGGTYNWQLIIKSKQRSSLVRIVNGLPKGNFTCDLDPINLL